MLYYITNTRVKMFDLLVILILHSYRRFNFIIFSINFKVFPIVVNLTGLVSKFRPLVTIQTIMGGVSSITISVKVKFESYLSFLSAFHPSRICVQRIGALEVGGEVRSHTWLLSFTNLLDHKGLHFELINLSL